jgi:hypothetical protein
MKNFRTSKIGIFNAEQPDRSVLVRWTISSAASIRFMKLRSMPCNADEEFVEPLLLLFVRNCLN